MGIHVIISNSDVVETILDKFKCFSFFKKNNIPTPETSLENKYRLIKPRFGRGSSGIIIDSNDITSMDGMISQELIQGTEYTVDVFCDLQNNPIYIIPRKRLNVISGKSTAGIVEKKEKICEHVKKICSHAQFTGPINLQCFEKSDGEVVFIEINPRVGGGMALGFAASENWVNLSIKNLVQKQAITTQAIKYGLQMRRYYSEVFFD